MKILESGFKVEFTASMHVMFGFSDLRLQSLEAFVRESSETMRKVLEVYTDSLT